MPGKRGPSHNSHLGSAGRLPPATATTTHALDGLTLLSAVSVAGSATTSVDYVNDSAGHPVAAYVSVPSTTSPSSCGS